VTRNHSTDDSILYSNEEIAKNIWYYNKEIYGQKTPIFGLGKTTGEMKCEKTYENWNFDYTWHIQEGVSYPGLNWINNPPIAENADYQQIPGYNMSFFLPVSDADADSIIAYKILKKPKWGETQVFGNQIIYSPQDTFKGIDSLFWNAKDEHGNWSNTAVIQFKTEKFKIKNKPLDEKIAEGNINIDSCFRELTKNKNFIHNSEMREFHAFSYSSMQNKTVSEPEKAFDLDPATAWFKGQQSGLVISFYEQDIKSIRILNGYTKSAALYYLNNRIKTLEVYAEFSINEEKKWFRRSFELPDLSFTEQLGVKSNYVELKLNLPSVDYISLNIVAIYKGDEYDETGISEILIEKGYDKTSIPGTSEKYFGRR
jgi:hypothetical protein